MSNLMLQTGAAATGIEGRFAAALRRWWRGLDEHRRLRVTVHTLRALSDHTLKDIGLERDEIEPAVRARLLER